MVARGSLKTPLLSANSMPPRLEEQTWPTLTPIFPRTIVAATSFPRRVFDNGKSLPWSSTERATAPSCKINPNTSMAEIPGKNLLSADVEIKGSIKFQNELTIDGKVEGEIHSTGTLTVGENAEIRGEIKTKSATVLGKVYGNITVDERCELKARAVLHGDLKASRLVIEEGATFVGRSEVNPVKGAARPEAVRPAVAAR